MPLLQPERVTCSRLFDSPPPGNMGRYTYWQPVTLTRDEPVAVSEKRCLDWLGSWVYYPVRDTAEHDPIEGSLWAQALQCPLHGGCVLNDRFRVWHDWLHNRYQLAFDRDSEIELAERCLVNGALPFGLRVVNYFETVCSIASGFGHCYDTRLLTIPERILSAVRSRAINNCYHQTSECEP